MNDAPPLRYRYCGCNGTVIIASLFFSIHFNSPPNNFSQACDKKTFSDSEDDDFEERNRIKMTNSATQTQVGTPGTPGTPTEPHNVTAAGEKEAAATASFYHGAWPPVDPTLWHSGPSSLGGPPLSSPAGRLLVRNLCSLFI